MATVSLDSMRQQLYEYYKKRGWDANKVLSMHNNQLIAIYWSYANKGFPIPKKKETEYKQLCMF